MAFAKCVVSFLQLPFDQSILPNLRRRHFVSSSPNRYHLSSPFPKPHSGNDKCADCGMKNPQWASVSFGTVFCLECSGVHRCVSCRPRSPKYYVVWDGKNMAKLNDRIVRGKQGEERHAITRFVQRNISPYIPWERVEKMLACIFDKKPAQTY